MQSQWHGIHTASLWFGAVFEGERRGMLGKTPPHVILAHKRGTCPAVDTPTLLSIRPPCYRYARPAVDMPALLSIRLPCSRYACLLLIRPPPVDMPVLLSLLWAVVLSC